VSSEFVRRKLENGVPLPYRAAFPMWARTNVEHNNYIQFLGTAGSRWVVARQLRSSAGIYLNLCGQKVYLDPGPGALVRCNMVDPPIDPSYLDGLIVTHNHIDHCNDINIMIDAMTAGGFNRGGALFAPKSCLEGENCILLNYLRPFLDTVVTLAPSQEYRLGELRFSTSIPHDHGPEVFGITCFVGEYKVAFLVDTKFFPELPADYAGVDLLIINVTFLDRPPHPKILHLSTHDVKDIVRGAAPKRVILTHFGTSMLEAGPHSVAAQLTDELGVEIVAADDGMVVPIS
jgi:ribonuclease BN (tRNA processing enzyme)